MLEGERWKNSRRFMLKTFRNLGNASVPLPFLSSVLCGKIVFPGMGKAGIQDRILHEAELLTDTLRKSNGEAYDPFSALSASVANVICTLCWNKRYEADDVVFRHILARLHSTSAYLVQAGPLLAYPSLRFVPGKFKRGWGQFMQAIDDIRAYLKVITEEHLKEYKDDEPQSFIEAFIKQQKLVGTKGEDNVFQGWADENVPADMTGNHQVSLIVSVFRPRFADQPTGSFRCRY
ncbi:hypothetical protein RvY_16945-1 [Ramazzottius varieornatus]|uniref:Cytochrome P450 n=1 Tax=Ramazzottius varieornatus TaxID=947166 RepID=A0A1D1W4I0_RAMVA|nr:hypothetical protein RvY_16945-1 [Ramazzottius varieornatus]